MCGGYTRVCVKCGRCGNVETRPIIGQGVCVQCGFVNDPQASRCEECGMPLPKLPGMPGGLKGVGQSAGQPFSDTNET